MGEKLLCRGLCRLTLPDDMYFSLDPTGIRDFSFNRVVNYFFHAPTCCDDIWSVTIQHGYVLKAVY